MNTRLKAAFRFVFGLVLLAWVGMGLTGWQAPPVAPEAEALRDALFGSGYIIPAVLIVYMIVGLSYVSGLYIALASVLLFPVSLNILLFHAFLNPNPRSLTIAGLLLLANLGMLWLHRSAFVELLKARRQAGS
jgi:putative oxidoreductase